MMEKTKIIKEHFMKRRALLKLVAFVLFGMCLLGGRKAEATLMLKQSQLAKEALDSNKTLFDDLSCVVKDIFDKNIPYSKFVEKMLNVCVSREKCIGNNIVSKNDIDSDSRLIAEAEQFRDESLTDEQTKNFNYFELSIKKANKAWEMFVSSPSSSPSSAAFLSPSSNSNAETHQRHLTHIPETKVQTEAERQRLASMEQVVKDKMKAMEMLSETARLALKEAKRKDITVDTVEAQAKKAHAASNEAHKIKHEIANEFGKIKMSAEIERFKEVDMYYVAMNARERTKDAYLLVVDRSIVEASKAAKEKDKSQFEKARDMIFRARDAMLQIAPQGSLPYIELKMKSAADILGRFELSITVMQSALDDMKEFIYHPIQD
jgi:hypothetical protein